MSSPDEDPVGVADVGLLTPVVAGTAGERLTSDRAIVAALVRVEAALMRALVRTEVAPTTAEATADAVAAATPDPRTLALAAPAGGNPVIPLVRTLRAAAGDDAAWIHYGATSQDVLDTALMLMARDVLRRAETDIGRLAATLADLARDSRGVPVVARTLTQPALPTTLAMRTAGWLAGAHDAVRAIRSAAPLPVSLGGPVGTTAAYGARGPAVVDAFASELDLAAPTAPWHTRRTPVLDVVHALTVTGAATGKVAADVLVLAQGEVGEVRESAGGPSSAMSHKANPTQSVLIAAAARELPPLASAVQASAVAEQERPAGAWHAEWQPLRTMLRLVAGATERTADLVDGLRFDPDAMARNLDALVAAVGADTTWVAPQVKHVDAWVDRVLAEHAKLFP